MEHLKIGSLFSGIGGLELGLERAGLGEVVWQVEIDPFCRSVLAKHWPNATRCEDVRTVGSATVSPVDIICGGFPCQDVSLAGKRAGIEGARSGLWAEFRRIIEEIEPAIIVIENVLGLRTAGLSRVLSDLADLGFDAEWSDLSAADVGAPHLRRRLFIVAAHPERIELRNEPGWLSRACRTVAAESLDDGENWSTSDSKCIYGWALSLPEYNADGSPPGWDEGADRSVHVGSIRDASDANRERKPQQSRPLGSQWQRSSDGGWWPPVGPVRRVDDGIPNRSHGKRLKALGNAVVPQCAEVIGRAIASALGVA